MEQSPLPEPHANALDPESLITVHVEPLLDWLMERARFARLRVAECSLGALTEWQITDQALRHRTGRYFSIAGLEVNAQSAGDPPRSQPIILQTEVGILGFAARFASNRELQLLIQAKVEPGNVGDAQIAPTVQATLSNYTRVHGGAATPYLDIFLSGGRGNPVLDSLQSEQGTRFLGKYNRNALVMIDENEELDARDNWRWASAGEVLELLDHDFTINTDSRSVLVCAPWDLLASPGLPFERQAERSEFASALANSYRERGRNDLPDLLREWRSIANPTPELVGADRIEEFLKKFSKHAGHPPGTPLIRGFKIEVEGREVPAWNQPLLAATGEERIVLVCRTIDGVLRFLFMGRREPGFTNELQLGPSIQGIPEEIAGCAVARWLDTQTVTTHITCMQSDEGGRFYRQAARYAVTEVTDCSTCPEFPESAWLTLGEIRDLLGESGCFSNEARSALSLLLRYLV